MQATMKLNIVNKEVMSVLNRTMANKDNYFERVYVKISLLIKDSILGNAFALVSLYHLHDEIINLSAYFDDEIDKFEGLIEKKKSLRADKINFIARYQHDFACNNALSLALYELMEIFDKLISTLKLLHLSGSMESRPAFYQLKERYQKKLNALLSQIIQTPSSQKHQITLAAILDNPCLAYEASINLNTLKEALDAPYAPGFSPQVLSNMKFKLKSHAFVQNKADKEVSL